MIPLWKKIAAILGLLFIVLYALLSNLIFFWSKYIESLLVLGISAAGAIVLIIGAIVHTINLTKNENDNGLLNNWVYLQEERKRQKKLLPISYIIMLLGVAFFIWLGKYTLDTAILMSKDLPYVLSKNYSKVECHIESNGFSYQRGTRHMQYITATNTMDNKYIFINFEHDYKKIKEFSNYIIWYLPNTKLGVRAEELP